MWIRRLRTTQRVLLAVFVVVAGVALPRAASAAEDVYAVSGIEVDVTRETATAAREAALAQGHAKAMRKLLGRLLPDDQMARVRELDPDEVTPYVRDFEIERERRSDVRYIASLKFHFKADEIRGLLRANGVLYAETQSKPLLVVPVLGPEGLARLWEDDNPWADAWAARRLDDGLVPFALPLGDLADVSTLDAQRALAGDRDALLRLARRYGAGAALVAQAIVEGDPESGGAQLQIRARRFDSQTPTTRLFTLRQQAEETLPELLGRGAAVLDHEIQEAWKQQNLVRPGSEATITISVPVRRLDDWLEVRRRLAEVGPIQQTSVTALSTNRALIEVSFVGDENQLDIALAQNDLDLSLGPSGWELRLAGAPAGRPLGEPSGTMPMESVAPDTGDAAATGDMPSERMSPGQLPQGQAGPPASTP